MSKRKGCHRGVRPRGLAFDPSRREFLAGMAATSVLALPGCGGSEPVAAAGLDPKDSGIDHIVVVMMENRSFDHFLGWLPGADGIQAGLSFPDQDGVMHDTFALSQDAAYGYQCCGRADPDHGYDGGRIELNGGAMDGWLLTPDTALGDHFPIGYYTASDLPFFAGAATTFTTCDRYFSGILSQTFPNRFYMHSGQTDRNDNALEQSFLPTIWDLMLGKGLTALYYYFDVPYIALWGDKYADITRQFSNFLADAQAGALPNLSFVDPNFGGSVGEGAGASADDHPFADIRDGQAFMNQVYNALRQSPNWEKTLLIINYDEWGGFFDHVLPPIGPISEAERTATTNAAGPGDGRLGFRVPCLLMGPRARRNHVEHTVLEPNSILDLVRWRFGLPGLSVRSGLVKNLAHVLDFENPPNLEAPEFTVPAGPFNQPCGGAVPAGAAATGGGDVSAIARARHYAEWQALWQRARDVGLIKS